MGDVASREGRTVLFVSHNMVSIQNLCPESLLLRDGNILKFGPTDDVISYYLKGFEKNERTQFVQTTDRKGNQQLRFTRIEILDLSNQHLSQILTGQNIKLRFYYDCDTPGINSVVCVSFVVKDRGYSLTNINSIDSGQSQLELFASGYFECIWPKFNLTANKYNCSLYCSINGETTDWIDDAFQLIVEDGDFFNTGKKIGFQSKFLIPNVWSSKRNI
jgi:lipopolysaccharide transport system ATP-binding protein